MAVLGWCSYKCYQICQNMERDITVWSSASRHLRMNMLIRRIPITTQTGYMLEPLATLTGCDHSSPFRPCVEDLYRQERVAGLRFTDEYGNLDIQLQLLSLYHFKLATNKSNHYCFHCEPQEQVLTAVYCIKVLMKPPKLRGLSCPVN